VPQPPAERETLELRCLFALSDARAAFFNDIVAHAGATCASPRADEDTAALREEAVFQIAQFYYLASQRGLGNERNARAFLSGHNKEVQNLLSDKQQRDALGLTVARLNECLFSDAQIENVVQEISEGKLRLNQSDLGSLLTLCQSPETTRKALIALGDGGLLKRARIGRVLIRSDATLERYFEKHLQFIVATIKAAIQEEGAGI
jgi:hypothetical protein